MKLFKSVIMCAVFSIFGLCALNAQQSETYVTVDKLLSKNIRSNADSVKLYADKLTFDEKAQLFTEHTQKAGKYQLINAFSFVGIGSYMQGDIFGGVVSSVLGAGGIGCIALGIGNIADMQTPSYGSSRPVSNTARVENMALMFGIGGGLLVTDILWGILKPKLYANKNNKIMKKALKLDDAKVSLTPVFNSAFELNGASFAVALKF